MIFKIHRYPEYCIGHGFDGAFCRLIKVIIGKSGFACCAVPSPKKAMSFLSTIFTGSEKMTYRNDEAQLCSPPH